MTAIPVCGDRACRIPAHQRYVGPLARRLAAAHPEPAPDRRPMWLRRGTTKVLDHGGHVA